MKIICPNCGNKIEANSNQNQVYCNRCCNTFLFSQGKERIDREYKFLQKSAFNAVYKKEDFDEADKFYQKMLELKENDLTTIISICLAKLFLQTFDNLMFTEIIRILDKYDIVLNSENTFIYLSFFHSDVFYRIDEFFEQSDGRLKLNDVFIKKEYFEYYKEGVEQIAELIKFFNDSIELLEQNEYSHYLESNTKFLEELKNISTKIDDIKNNKFKVNESGLLDYEGNKISDEEYNIENIPELDFRVAYKSESLNKKAYIILGLMMFLGVLGISLLTAGFISKNNIVLYVGFVPIAFVLLLFPFLSKIIKNN